MYIAEAPYDFPEAETAGRVLRDFIASCPAAFIMLDHNLRQLEVSPRWRTDFGGIASDLLLGQHFYESYPELPDHLKASHRKGLAGEVTRVLEDHFTIGSTEINCAWEVRPWGDIGRQLGGIMIYAEHLDTSAKATKAPGKSRELAARGTARPAPSGLMSRGISWTREGIEVMQSLLSCYREMACTCEPGFPPPGSGHEWSCPAHSTVPLIVKTEQAIRRQFMLEELLRKDWTLVN